MKFFESTPSKPKMLYTVYNDYSKIGQVGYAGATAANITIRIRGMDQPVSVLPPEWTILFTFMTNAISILDEKERTRFETLVVSAEEDRYYRTQRGKHAAVQYGYYQSAPGTSSLKPSEREKLSPRTAESPYDKSNIAYKYSPTLVQRGYNAAIKGEEYPGIPRRNEKKNP